MNVCKSASIQPFNVWSDYLAICAAPSSNSFILLTLYNNLTPKMNY